MIVIDGKDGGGQMLRTALALSALIKLPFTMENIRSSRPKPGLSAQHLKVVETFVTLTDGYVEGCELGSERLLFYPRGHKVKDVEVDIGTAGSCTLFLQALLPFLSFQSKKLVRVTVKGGSDVLYSMGFDYFKEVLLPSLPWTNCDCKLIQRGYFPKGNGEIKAIIRPVNRDRLDRLSIGSVMQIKGVAHGSAALAKENVVERCMQSSKFLLKSYAPVILSSSYQPTASDDFGLCLYAVCDSQLRIGADGLSNGGSSEALGTSVANNIIEMLKSRDSVDTHLADNLIPYLALCGGSIRISSLSKHVKNNVKVCEIFLGVEFNYEDGILRVEPTEHPF